MSAWGWQADRLASALEPAAVNDAQTTFKLVTLETLLDSPVFAGRYFTRLDLDPSGAVPSHIAVTKSASLQPPMPSLASGEILGA